MEQINDYYGKVDLKHRIVQQYIAYLLDEKRMRENILADKTWASTDSDYHRGCRSSMETELKELNKQIKFLI